MTTPLTVDPLRVIQLMVTNDARSTADRCAAVRAYIEQLEEDK